MNNKILLCVSGGIAAYKAIDLASLLIKQGYEVKTILTKGALEFVSGINFSALTDNSVHTSLFEDSDPIPHIRLAEWADLMVVAPATANVMSKAANGISDDLLSATLLAHRKAVLFVPAMNVYMFEHPATRENLKILEDRGNYILPPETGRLACGYTGKGKYPPNQEVLAAIQTYLFCGRDLIGKKVLVTAGATIEALDPMRYLSNRSSGKMGVSIARALALRGAEVTLIHANISVPLPHYFQRTIFTESAAEMHEAVMSSAKNMDWIVKCAAVADYSPQNTSKVKLPKQAELNLALKQTKDILFELGQEQQPGQKLIGFAAQSDESPENAIAKLISKKLDLICLNNIAQAGKDNNCITLIKNSSQTDFTILQGDKFSLAHQLIDNIKTL